MWSSAILMAILSLVHCQSKPQGYSYQKPSFGSPAEFVGEAALGGTHPTSTDTLEKQPKHVYLHFVPSLQTGVRPEESQLDGQSSLPIKELKISLRQSSSSPSKKKPRVVISPLNAEQVYTREHQGSRSSKKNSKVTSWVNFNSEVPTRKKVQKRPTQEERAQKIPIYRGPVNGQNIPGSLQGTPTEKNTFQFSTPVGKVAYANEVNGGGYVVANAMQGPTDQMGYILVMPSFGKPVLKETPYSGANVFEQNVPQKTVQSFTSVDAEANKGETSAHIYKSSKTTAAVNHQPTTQGYTESSPTKNRPAPSGCCSGNGGSSSSSTQKGLVSQGWKPIFKPGQVNPNQHGAIESIPSSLTQESGQDGYTSQGYQYRKPLGKTDNRPSEEPIQQGFSGVKSSKLSPQKGYDAAKFYDTYRYRTLPEEVIRGQTYESQEVIQGGTPEANLGEDHQGYNEDINEGNGYRTLPDEIIQENGGGNGYKTLLDDITQGGYQYEPSTNQGGRAGQDLQQEYENGGYVYGKTQQEPTQFDHGSWVGQGKIQVSSSGQDSQQNFGNGGYGQSQRKPIQGQQGYNLSPGQGAEISSSGQDLQQQFENGGYIYGDKSSSGQDLQQRFENGGYIYGQSQRNPGQGQKSYDSSPSQEGAQISSSGQDLQQTFDNGGYIYGNGQHRSAQEQLNSGISESQGPAQVSSPGQDFQQNGGYFYGSDEHSPSQEQFNTGISTSQGAQVSSPGQDLQQKFENGGYIYDNSQHRPAQEQFNSGIITSQGSTQVSSGGQDLQQNFGGGYIYGKGQPSDQDRTQISSSGQDLQQNFGNSGYVYGEVQRKSIQGQPSYISSPLSGQGKTQVSSSGQELQQKFENGGYIYGNSQQRPAQEQFNSGITTSQGSAQVSAAGQDQQQNGGYIYGNAQPNQDRTEISSSGADLQQNFGHAGYVYGEVQRKSIQGQTSYNPSPLPGQGKTQVSSSGQELQQKFENGGYIYGTSQHESNQQSSNYDSSGQGRTQVGFSEQNPQQEFGTDGKYDQYKTLPDELTQKQLNYEPQGTLEEIPQVNFAEDLQQEFVGGQISHEDPYKTLPNQLTGEANIPQGVNQETLLDVSLPPGVVQGFSSDGVQYPGALPQGELQKEQTDHEITHNAQFTIQSYPEQTQFFGEQFLGYPSI